MPAILNYLLHLGLASALVLAFFLIYTKLTPYDEVVLIRGGNCAAALSLGGTLIGFAATVASACAHTADYREFLAWALVGMVMQLLVFVVTTRLMHMSKDQIEADNCAFGGLLGAISVAIGIINAGCIS